MDIRIRESVDADYEQIAAVWTSAYPGYPVTAEEARHWDTHRDKKCVMVRFVCERADDPDAGIIGLAMYNHEEYMYHPRKYAIDMGVRPEFQGQGVGKALYDHLMADLLKRDPLVLRTYGREGNERALRFLADRGFVEEMREWESKLDVTTFDFAPYEGLDARMREQGIELKSLAELMNEPGIRRKLYELEVALMEDVPATDTPTAPSFECFAERTFSSPNLLPEAYTIAVHNGELVGLSALWKGKADEVIGTGLTGVRREYRRKGIATAMKVRGIRWCADHGHATIRTENEQNNVGMLGINMALGFVKQPAWIAFAKTISEE